MHVVAEAQRNGGVCAYIDAEHAMDPIYAKAIGVDIDQLLISQPDTGEQALEIADMLVRSGALDVVVIDSVAALTPRAEIEGEMGDSHVGLQARLMSQALRKLTANLNRSKTIMIFINQLREKIGVMFGCMSYGTRVTLADGTQEKIGKIVNQKLPVEVLTYDFERGELTTKPVTNWFDNGIAERFLQFTVERGGGNGKHSSPRRRITRSPRPAGGGRLASSSSVIGCCRRRPRCSATSNGRSLLGGLMGDGALSSSRSGNGARFRWGHGAKQVAYGDWKASMFANVGVSRSTNSDGAVFHDMQPLTELAELREAVYVGGKKVLSDDYLKRLTPLSLAVWYMDDGCVHACVRRDFSSEPSAEVGAPRSAWRRCPPTPVTVSFAISPTHGASRPSSSLEGKARKAVASVPHRRDGEVPGVDRSVRPSVDGVQAAAALPRAVRRRAGVRRATPGADADAHHQDRRQAADTEHAQVRPRGRPARTTTSSTG